ncbi:MAG: O-acetyl-ADP-ribose deacetylase [Gammaproteobacteria bacterium]|nr:O-acetyl-ADP-ribose deacetylase [Gammaproteobacteria bacterium]MDE2344854.1 O-acetyl-ADP-ribose deacetylase [Gammaproteobacteria bacterium]
MIKVLQYDITDLDVDIIVNAANTSLLGGGGVDGAIHHAAGPELREACKKLGGCPTGEARITPGFRLKAEWIIHAVGPVWYGGGKGEPQLLDSCYRSAFHLALETKARSIAFPCISTGIYRYPKEDAARIALKVMHEYEKDFRSIVACCFDAENAVIYRKLSGPGGQEEDDL